jgi:hypothetical protein
VAAATSAARISPQLIWWPWPGCIPNCVCFSQVDCPCCWGFPPRPYPWPSDTF